MAPGPLQPTFCAPSSKFHLLGSESNISLDAKEDRNTKFFHSFVKIHHHINKVHAIRDSAGTIVTDQSGIENCFLDFYKNIWHSTLDLNVDFLFNTIPDDFVVLTDVDRVDLIIPVMKQELYQTLKSMPRGKSPSQDGLNVEFYIFYWNILGDHFYNVISYFFQTSKFPSSSSKTFVTLIPKKRKSSLYF